jgi:hypothetical protein
MMAQVGKGEVSALKTVCRLVGSEDGGAAAAILTLWTFIQQNDCISQG